MSKLLIEGVPPYDGGYDLDLAGFTGRELHTIKEISGVRGGELQEALQAGDYDLVVAFAVIVLRRAGKDVDPDEIMNAEVGAITVDLETQATEEEERPPATATPGGEENSNDGVANDNAGTTTSGSPSTDDGVLSPNRLEVIGSPSSESSAFDLPTSVT
jgi:hypothetical protein